jgi:hypothetical protein
MVRLSVLMLASTCALPALSCSSSRTAAPNPAAKAGFERLAALEGEWTGEGPADAPGPMTVTYELTGGGSALIETLFAGTPTEMVTVYTVEDGALMLTHYCMLGNQPRMKAGPMQGNVLEFHFAGGANIDPAKDDHMHDARIEFVAPDEIVTEWTGWTAGKPASDHRARVNLKRKS